MLLRLSGFLALVLLGVSGVAGAQAIDCASSALNNSEQAVCASTSLRSLAARMDKRYPLVTDAPGVKQSQLEWTTLRDRCNGNVACLIKVYRQRNAYLAALPLPEKPLTAADTPNAPTKHLFLRHAPAQLLTPASAQQPANLDVESATAQLERAAGPLTVEEHTTHRNSIWFLAGIMSAAILLWQMLTNVCGKCPSCHHWFAKIEIDQRNLANDPSELSTHRRRGLRQRAMTNSVAIPEPMRGRVAAVRHYNQCRMCLHEWETTTQETK